MSDHSAEIEAATLNMLRAWVAGDVNAMKKLTPREFFFMIGTSPPQLLDRPSFLAALDRAFACRRFALREVFARKHGNAGWLVAGAELDLVVGGKPWTGPFLISAFWRPSMWTGKWLLADFSLARVDPDEGLAQNVRALQLWNKARGTAR